MHNYIQQKDFFLNSNDYEPYGKYITILYFF